MPAELVMPARMGDATSSDTMAKSRRAGSDHELPDFFPPNPDQKVGLGGGEDEAGGEGEEEEPGRGKRKKDYGVNPEEFVLAWQTSSSTEEVSRKLSMPIPIVVARASAYRKSKVHLKKFVKKPSRTLDVDSLNKLIDELGKKKKGQ